MHGNGFAKIPMRNNASFTQNKSTFFQIRLGNIQQEYIIAARLSAHTKVEKVTNSFKNSGNTTYIQTEQPRETPKFEL